MSEQIIVGLYEVHWNLGRVVRAVESESYMMDNAVNSLVTLPFLRHSFKEKKDKDQLN